VNWRFAYGLTRASVGEVALVCRMVLVCRMALVGVMLTVAGEGSSLAGQSFDVRDVVRDTVLDNGLHVITAKNSSLPLATIEIVVRGGALAQVAAEDEGLPHILEHMLFKSFDRSGRDWWAERTAEMNATYNGTTGDERVTYYLTLPSENVNDGLELLADLVRSPRFEEDILKAEKSVVLGELQRNASDPYFVANMFTDLTLWRSAFPRKNAIGNITTIMAATRDQLERHYERFYVPNNAAIIVTGNVEADEIFSSTARHFSSWDRGADSFAELPPPPIAPLFADSVFVIAAEASDVTFSIRWLGPAGAQDREATYATALFSRLVNLPTSATQRRLVDTDLFSIVSAGYRHVNQVSAISVTARTTLEKLPAASRALVEEIDLLALEDYFDHNDLEAAIKRLRLARAEQQQTTAGLAHTLADAWSIAGIDYYLDYVDNLQRQTPATVREHLSRYVFDRPRIVSILISSPIIDANAEVINAALADWRTP